MTQPPMIDNPRSDRIKAVASLTGRSARRRSGRILVEGPQAVRELALHRAESIIDIYITDRVEMADPALAKAVREATRWVHSVTPEVAAAISPDCQGIAAVAGAEALEHGAEQIWERLDLDLVALEAKSIPGASDVPVPPNVSVPFVVCLPETQDPGNVGTVIRTADAMGAAAVILGSGTADPANPKVIRASAGSVFHIPLVRVPLETVRGNLRAGDWAMLGTAGHGADVRLDDMAEAALTGHGDALTAVLARPHAWVFGNEARGLAVEDIALCDLLVEIPLAGHAESLNAAAAAAMCLYISHLATTNQ